MQTLIEWIMQIVIFMFIGTIVQFLLPNHSLKKYVNIVIGLLLLLILTKPLLYIFSIPLQTTFDNIERSLFSNEQYVQTTEQQIMEQKKDIENEQAAYIWNEVKEQYIEAAKGPLHAKHDVELVDVTFVLTEDEEDVEKMTAHIQRNTEHEHSESTLIEPVVIDTTNGHTTRISRDDVRDKNGQIVTTLAEIWELDERLIQLKWERGT